MIRADPESPAGHGRPRKYSLFLLQGISTIVSTQFFLPRKHAFQKMLESNFSHDDLPQQFEKYNDPQYNNLPPTYPHRVRTAPLRTRWRTTRRDTGLCLQLVLHLDTRTRVRRPTCICR